jgi:cytochrome c oxidase cbb3-type subunit III
MSRGANIAAVGVLSLLMLGCENLPGKPGPDPEVPRPDSILDPAVLFAENCAGCHGKNGVGGAATPIGSPEYQAWVDEGKLHKIVAEGVRGTAMSGFSRKVGGQLTEQQIDALVKGLHTMWFKGDVFAGQNPPKYTDATPGDSQAGEGVYESSCSRCHGKVGGAVGSSGSVLNSSLLALVSEQAIRNEVVIGRPDLNVPDWRHVNPDHKLSDKEVRDVVAFVVSRRSASPGQPYPTKSAKAGTGEVR